MRVAREEVRDRWNVAVFTSPFWIKYIRERLYKFPKRDPNFKIKI